MPSDRRELISDLYHRALARAPEARAAFLIEASNGDEGLRKEVASLLEFEPASAGIFERPAVVVAAVASGTSMIDRRIGPYTIVAPLGAGGMGEVYRARDSKLGRDVAIKILPAHFTADSERRARFAREARTLATLNHPHIGAIYGLEEADGVTALVLELVEGPTLADRLTRGPLPLAGALTIARQIAAALEAAHESGIVHRDLKPANIVLQGPLDRLSTEVRARVLDFGLAKPMAVDSGAPTHGLSGSFDGTADGRILGTPAYMSPEQARGLAVDKRIDIWAFGCVVFEMLSGRRAFGGDTISDTFVSVLEREPDWEALPAATPKAVRRLLGQCLEKEPARRRRDIADLRLELEDAAIADAGAPRVEQRPPGNTIAFRVWLAAAAIAVAIAGAAAWFGLGHSEISPTAERMTRLTFEPGLQTDPSLSPDGTFVAYSSNQKGNFDIYIRPVADANAKAVQVTTDPAHDWQPHWSIDDQLVFRSERDGGGLYVVSRTGGHERRVAPFGHQPQWSPDGSRILFSSWMTDSLYVVGRDGGTPQELRVRGSVFGAYGWAGDARHVALLTTGGPPELVPSLRIVDVIQKTEVPWTATAEVQSGFKRLGVQIRSPRSLLTWASDGKAVYAEAGVGGVSGIWKVDIDPAARVISGGPHRIAQMAEAARGVTVAQATGAIAFGAADRAGRIWRYPLDATRRRLSGQPTPLTAAETTSLDPHVTPDGRLLTFSVNRPGSEGRTALQIKFLPGGPERTLRESDTARGELRFFAQPSPDASRVAFRYVAPGADRSVDLRGAPTDIRVIDLATDEETRLTKTDIGPIVPTGWSTDRRFLVVSVDRRRIGATASGRAIGLLPLAAAPDAEGDMKIVTLADDPNIGLHQPVMSPNDRWIAFIGPSFRLFVVGPSDGSWIRTYAQREWQLVAGDDSAPKDKPRWSVDGRLLYFTSARGGMLNVWAVAFDPASGPDGAPFKVTNFDGPGEQIPPVITAIEIAVTPDALLIPTERPTGGIWLVHPRR